MFEMDINKTDMFEKFFNGFQEKFIEAFMAAGEEKILVRILENQKASKEEYRTYFNCAWEFLEKTTIAEQQAKVEELEQELESERAEQIKGYSKISDLRLEREELQKQVTDLDNRATQYALDEMATAKLNGELQKRVDLVKRELKAAKEGHYGFNHEGADIDGFIFDIEQALKGEKE